MKQTLTFICLLLGLNSFAQVSQNSPGASTAPKLTLSPRLQSYNKNGGPIKKGDTVYVALNYVNNGSSLRNLYLDFQHQINAYDLIGVDFPTPGSQGSALPTGTSTSFTNYYYPGYYFNNNNNNNTEDGWLNANNASYGYVNGGQKSINRVQLQFATAGGNNTNLADGLLANLKFLIKQTGAGYTYDSVYMNFAYGWNAAGNTQTVWMPKPKGMWIGVDSTSNALINGLYKTNATLYNSGITPQLAVLDSGTSNVVFSQAVPNNGVFTVAQQVAINKPYQFKTAILADSVPSMLAKAVTVSDYTMAQQEFIHQNLDGTYTNSNMKSGITWIAADVNMDGKFDGGDLNKIFAQAVGADTIYKPAAGSAFYLPVFTSSEYDSLTYSNWTSALNHYTANFKTADTAKSVTLKYIIPGDINRSHSSLVETASGVVANASAKPQTGTISSFSVAPMAVNTATDVIPTIDVTLNNTTVTSNSITVPFTTDAKGSKITALQFEVVYDATQIKFEEIQSFLPNTWYVFANSQTGKVRFGAIDRELKSPYGGIAIPFTLRFSSIGNGVDLNTKIKVTSAMDAADGFGNQLGINLNTTSIRLTGYNNF